MTSNTEIINGNISELLDTTYENNEVAVLEPEVVDLVPAEETSLEDDSSEARSKIKDLVDIGLKAISELAMVAKESQTARDYEVLATLIKNTGELNSTLIDIHKKVSDINTSKGKKSSSISVDKAVVFTGSTTDLIKIIKENKE